MRRLVLTLVLLSVGFYGAAGYIGTSQEIGNHPEWRKLVASPSDYGLQSEVVAFPSKDGILLKAWWLPAHGPTEGRPGANLILAHGRDGNRSSMLSRAAFLVRHG